MRKAIGDQVERSPIMNGHVQLVDEFSSLNSETAPPRSRKTHCSDLFSQSSIGKQVPQVAPHSQSGKPALTLGE